MKQFFISLIPKSFLPIVKWAFQKRLVYWKGNYTTWAKAESETEGYNTDVILNAVIDAVRKVKRGEALYERDSVLFYLPEKKNALYEIIQQVATQNSGKIRVIDFGGSLGSTYFQHKKYLDTLPGVEWNVIEQAKFVSFAKMELEDEKLKFHYKIEECKLDSEFNLLVFSSVLQYLEHGIVSLDALLKLQIQYCVIDRTNFTFEPNDIITKQTVPSSIYKASYPCWFFNPDKMVQKFQSYSYSLVNQWTNDTLNIGYQGGFLFEIDKK